MHTYWKSIEANLDGTLNRFIPIYFWVIKIIELPQNEARTERQAQYDSCKDIQFKALSPTNRERVEYSICYLM